MSIWLYRIQYLACYVLLLFLIDAKINEFCYQVLYVCFNFLTGSGGHSYLLEPMWWAGMLTSKSHNSNLNVCQFYVFLFHFMLTSLRLIMIKHSVCKRRQYLVYLRLFFMMLLENMQFLERSSMEVLEFLLCLSLDRLTSNSTSVITPTCLVT